MPRVKISVDNPSSIIERNVEVLKVEQRNNVISFIILEQAHIRTLLHR